MAKTKVSELTRELVAKATSLIGSATAAQKKVQERTLELKKKENDLRRKQDDQRKQQEREESRRQQKEAANMSGISADDLAKFAKAAEAAEARNAEIKAEEARQKAEAEAKAKQEAEQKAAARPVQPARPRDDRRFDERRSDDRRFDDRRSDDRRPDDRRFGRPAGTQPQQGQGMQQNGERRFGRPVPGKEYQQQGQGMQQNGERRFGRPAGMQQGGPRPSAPMMNKDKDADYDNKNDHRGGNKNGKSGFQRKSSGAGELIATVEKEKVSNYDPNKKLYEQRHDQEHTPAKPAKPGNASKQSARSSGAHGIGMDTEEDFVRRKAKKSKQQMPAAKPEPVRIEKAVMTSETITVKDLSEKIGKASGEIIKKLIILGTMANINAELDLDTAQLVCSEFGVEMEYKPEKTAEDALDEENFTDKEEDLIIRNPVVTIMGHVDHGKTSLLDHIRNAHVTAGEAGGITQHIGAYTVNMNGQGITFLDTPGHEAFTAMRARGAMATDIAVLVVAADDGVMPQTIESINHAKAANVPVIVAINKCDKPTANPERIRQQLTEYNLVAEEWGGDTMMVEVSAHTGMGVDQLLESILILSEVQELKANPNRKARGIIIEAKLDKGRGPVATVLVQNGTLKIGDTIVAGTAFGRVRAMVNDRGERVKTAGPSMPVEVIGFNDVPSAGDIISAVDDDRLSRQVAEERKDKLRAALIKTQQKTSLDDLFNQISEGQIKDLNIIVKADVQGSVEAVKQSLEKLTNEEVRVRCIHGGVGAITETDVMLAAASNAIIIGFNVRHDNIVRDLAEKESVEIRLYRVIYNAIEDVEAAMKGMLAPKFKEVIIGRAEVRQIYHVSGVGTVAGCYVTDGKLARNCSVRLLRDNIVITETKLGSLKRFKDDAKEVATGYECGCGLEGYNDVKEGDVFECFQMEEIKQ